MTEAPLAASLGSLAEGDLPRAAGVLAHAFRDNPLNVAVIRSDDPDWRQRCNAHGMRMLLPVARAHGHLLAARVGSALAGALVATPPFSYPLPAASLRARLRCLRGQGWRVARRWAAVFEALDALHPTGPHWYLGTLGVDPSLQGRGVGRALLADWVARAERDGVSAYLETDSPANVAFYSRAGFEVEGEALVLGVRIWRMSRVAPADSGFPSGARGD